MTGFTESMLCSKLADLNDSQQSVQTLSLWLIHHRKHYQLIVKTWIKEITEGPEGKKLTLMYLANDVIQNSKKKGPEFGKEFSTVFKKAFSSLGQSKCNEKTLKKLDRILTVWGERQVYDSKTIDEYRKLLHPSKREYQLLPESPPPEKRSKISMLVASSGRSINDNNSIRGPLTQHRRQEEVEVDGEKELHVTLSPVSPPRDPPETEELIKALVDLENAASMDVAVREKISKLPPEVSEVKLLAKLEAREEMVSLLKRVNAAVDLLTEYNERLSGEMEERKRVTQMLKDFTLSQKELMSQAQRRIEEYREKLAKVELVKHEVFSHMSNLPNLKRLPDVTAGGLAPLPSAGDLFT